MLIDLRRGLAALAAFTVLCGLAYPLAVLGAGQLAFRGAANGSLQRDGRDAAVGSALLGQGFDQPGYFWGRPSAAGKNGYDPTASGASNLGPTSADLDAAVRGRLAALLESHPGARPEDVPAELVIASASGLDPDISPAGAEFQVGRVAAARGLAPEQVRELVRQHIQGRTLGFLGEPRVNVLRLNLALDREATTP
jgi:K+-transporting ATPase ATPase C chain